MVSSARHAGLLIALALLIAAVLEAVFRIANLLSQPINPILLAAGAISASLLWTQRRGG